MQRPGFIPGLFIFALVHERSPWVASPTLWIGRAPTLSVGGGPEALDRGPCDCRFWIFDWQSPFAFWAQKFQIFDLECFQHPALFIL
jgi:hypothetical protein